MSPEANIPLLLQTRFFFFCRGGGTPHIDPTRLVDVYSALRKFNPKENMTQKTSEFQRQSRLGIISYFKLFISLSSSVVRGGNVSKVQILPFGLQNPFFWMAKFTQPTRMSGWWGTESNPSSPFTPSQRARPAVFSSVARRKIHTQESLCGKGNQSPLKNSFKESQTRLLPTEKSLSHYWLKLFISTQNQNKKCHLGSN